MPYKTSSIYLMVPYSASSWTMVIGVAIIALAMLVASANQYYVTGETFPLSMVGLVLLLPSLIAGIVMWKREDQYRIWKQLGLPRERFPKSFEAVEDLNQIDLVQTALKRVDVYRNALGLVKEVLENQASEIKAGLEKLEPDGSTDYIQALNLLEHELACFNSSIRRCKDRWTKADKLYIAAKALLEQSWDVDIRLDSSSVLHYAASPGQHKNFAWLWQQLTERQAKQMRGILRFSSKGVQQACSYEELKDRVAKLRSTNHSGLQKA